MAAIEEAKQRERESERERLGKFNFALGIFIVIVIVGLLRLGLLALTENFMPARCGWHHPTALPLSSTALYSQLSVATPSGRRDSPRCDLFSSPAFHINIARVG